jgi:hypothetical protein
MVAELEGRSTLNKKQTIRIARLTLAAAVVLTMTGNVAARNRPGKVVLLRPTELPELARVPGQAMVLHATGNGRTFLYVEQNDGARLAIFDVTDLARIKQEPAAQLDAPGSFDFVSALGDNAELIRFRDGQGEAVLDLHKAKLPTIKIVPGLKFEGSTERLVGDGFAISGQASVESDANARDYQIFATVTLREPERLFDVKQVRQEITNDETGTTFLLAADGLYVIRRLAVEEEYEIHQHQMSDPG